MNPGHLEVLQKLLGPNMAGCVEDAQRILGFQLLDKDQAVFLKFHDFVTNPQPKFITDWRSDPAQEKWYNRFVGGLHGVTRDAYASTFYHSERLISLEKMIMEALEKRNLAEIPAGSTVALGSTLLWDFEYHAFVLSYRTCLDLFTRGIAGFFKQEFHRFSKLETTLVGQKPASVSNALIEVHRRHIGNFEFVLSAGSKKSVRDRITHYEWVGAGTINLRRDGISIVGGGENFKLTFGDGQRRICGTIRNRLAALITYIDEMLETLAREAKAWEAEKGSQP